jgi:hypothetical protein
LMANFISLARTTSVQQREALESIQLLHHYTSLSLI